VITSIALSTQERKWILNAERGYTAHPRLDLCVVESATCTPKKCYFGVDTPEPCKVVNRFASISSRLWGPILPLRKVLSGGAAEEDPLVLGTVDGFIKVAKPTTDRRGSGDPIFRYGKCSSRLQGFWKAACALWAKGFRVTAPVVSAAQNRNFSLWVDTVVIR